MSDARNPQTDRELLLKLDSKLEGVENQIDNLAKSIDEFGNKLVSIEENKIHSLETRIVDLENIWQQVKGGWRFAVIVWLVVSAVLGWIIAWALKSFIR